MVVAKNRTLGDSIIFIQQFFLVSEGDLPSDPPGYTTTLAIPTFGFYLYEGSS